MNNIQFYILIILIECFFTNDKIYRIKFGLFNQKSNENEASIINNIYHNGIYLNLSIGTPPQIIPFELDSNSQTFSISKYFFNKNLSSTYEQLSQKEEYYAYEQIDSGLDSKDVLNIDKNIHKKINFIFAEKYPSRKKNQLGIIGLHIPKNVKKGVYPFFTSLKEAELINSYTWTLKYFDNISLYDLVTYKNNKDNAVGEFIFGDEPSNYEDDKFKYNEKGFHKITPLSTKDYIDWVFEFNNIYLSFTDNQNNSKISFVGGNVAEIVINFSYMLCPQIFFSFLKEKFFDQYIKDEVCSIKKVDYLYTYFECEYNSTFRVSSFPNICFEHKGFETTFNLTYKDLFIVDKKSKKYIFLIFTKDYLSDWVLGTPFLRKYQFVFNNDLKTIGYYKQIDYNEGNNEDEYLKEMNKHKTVKTVFIFILIIIFSFLLIFFGMLIQRKYFNKNRKIRANELEENFSYESYNNKDINTSNKIIKEDNEKSSYFNL